MKSIIYARVSNTRLKGCPFCGKKLEIDRTGGEYFIACQNPKCPASCHVWDPDEKCAITRWNHREDGD